MIELALTSSNAIAAAEEEYQLQADAHNWSAKANVGFNSSSTYETAAGASAGVRVDIPLFDRSHEIKLAKLRADHLKEKDSRYVALVKEVEDLCEAAGDIAKLTALQGLKTDHLEYQQRAVKQGLAEPDSLWAEVEKVQGGLQDIAVKAGKLKVNRVSLARRYGGDRWQELLTLLENATDPAPAPAPAP